MHFPDHFWPDLIIPWYHIILIIIHTLGKDFFKKWSDKWQGILNGRYHWKTWRSVWSKYKPILNQFAEKSQLDWWIKFTKKYLWSVVYQHKKQPLSKVSACCRCSLPSRLLVGMGLLARCNCNKHYYFSGLLQVQQTAQMVGYCYNKYECWSGASVSDMHACMHMFTDMTGG